MNEEKNTQKEYGAPLFEYEYTYSHEHLLRLNRELNKLRKKRVILLIFVSFLFILAEVCFYFASETVLMIITFGLIVFFYPIRKYIEKRRTIQLYNGNTILHSVRIKVTFYENCIIQTHEKGYIELKYTDAIRLSETKTDIFIMFSERSVIDLYKENVPEGLYDFLKTKIMTK